MAYFNVNLSEGDKISQPGPADKENGTEIPARDTMSRVMDLEILETNFFSPPRVGLGLLAGPPPSPSNPFSPPPMAGIDMDTPTESANDTTFVEEITILSDSESGCEGNGSLEVIAIVPIETNNLIKKKSIDAGVIVLSSDTEVETDVEIGEKILEEAGPKDTVDRRPSPIPMPWKTDAVDRGPSPIPMSWKMAPKVNSITKPVNENEAAGGRNTLPGTAAQLREAEKKRKMLNLEEIIKEKMEEIRELDKQEVDWDAEDDNNSSYMQRERLIDQCMKNYDLLCELSGCSKRTGRMIQKRVKLENVTPHSLVDQAVEEFVNESGFFDGADYQDIWEIVAKKCNVDLKLGLPDAVLKNFAKKLHEVVIHQKRHLRKKDESLVMPDINDAVDPADEDPELEAKLLENSKKAKSITSPVEDSDTDVCILEIEDSTDDEEFEFDDKRYTDNESTSEDECIPSAAKLFKV